MESQNLIMILLSNYRQPSQLTQPLTLTRRQILNSLHCAASIDAPNWQDEVQRSLDELQAQGEILLGAGKRYCIAPPTLLSIDEADVSNLRFQGDRAYLPWVHQVLKTGQSLDQVCLKSQGQSFQQLQEKLCSSNVRFLTVKDSLQTLPKPQKPIMLGKPLGNSPFSEYSEIDIYVPQSFKTQSERWQSRSTHSVKPLPVESILRIPDGSYLWLSNGKFYELDSEVAVLAMFAQDEAMNSPLLIAWDESPGRLNLQDVILPYAYARWLWRLSEPDREHYRTRLILPQYRPWVKQALPRLGCQLV
jgi:hypothetical protein